jgi:uncharacterized protein (DUF305 family)
MKKESLIYGIIGFLIGSVLVWSVMTNSSNSGVGMMRNQMDNNPNNTQIMRNIDAHFIEQMIPHHEDAITMAKLAQEKATHPEIKALAQNIITSQSQEIDQMKSWYKEWFGRELPTGPEVMQYHGMMSGGKMHMGMMGNEMDMERLKQATDFDKVFIEDMIPHHQMAVMMANMLKNGTQRAEMKKLADDIITAQTKEIDQMRQWYKNWGY